jgi:hypothetical protein
MRHDLTTRTSKLQCLVALSPNVDLRNVKNLSGDMLKSDDWRSLRRRGIPLIVAAGVALAIRTASECHTVLWFVGVHSTWPPTIWWGALVWLWWVSVVLGLWCVASQQVGVFHASWITLVSHCIAAPGLAYLHLSILGTFVAESSAIWPVWSEAHLARGCITGESFSQDLLIYSVLLVLSSSVYQHLRSRRAQLEKLALERELSDAQLQALQSQVQPHFLFNAHNTVLSLIDLGRNVEAAEALYHLNAILRSALRHEAPNKIPFAEELKTVQSYLALQLLRFPDRLQIHFDVKADALETLVPNFLLQPIVENAIHHGIEPMMGGGRIEAKVRREGEMLCLRVRDNGSGRENAQTSGHGIGLRNLRARLEHLYPGHHHLDVGRRSMGGFEVNIQIPFEPFPL